MRGRKPTPLPLRKLRGNPRQHRMPPELKPRADRPSRPEWLSVEAKHEWGRVVPELERLGLLTIVDRAARAAYCSAWGHLVTAEQAMQESSVIGPYWTIYNTAVQQVRAFCAEFGLTPSSHRRMTLP